MKITPMASEFVGILASVVKASRGYMTYIGGCVRKSRIVKLTDSDRQGCRDISRLHRLLWAVSGEPPIEVYVTVIYRGNAADRSYFALYTKYQQHTQMCTVWALHVVVINCGMYPVLHYMYLKGG